MSRDAAGVLVVAESTGRVLLALRSQRVRNPGTWSCFGGQIERGETAEEAASRELMEEAGLDYEPSDFAFIHERDRDGGTYFTFMILVRREVKVRLNDENDESGWFDPDDLPEPLHPGAAALFDAIDVEELIEDW